MEANVNARLYDFLKENETGMYIEGKSVKAYVHVRFFNMEEFVEIVGTHIFEEGGIQVDMFDNAVSIELNDIIENEGQSILSYKNCFEKNTIERYRAELEGMEVPS
ncbi:hypothetical protein AAGG74_15325 [Bacillus mexicanus]|uniref:hypothetical protein n=1 Tax=Bacillus mexicanus TaxID=2834415 RepID=UPI003D232FD6